MTTIRDTAKSKTWARSVDLNVRGGRIVTPIGVQELELRVANGKVVETALPNTKVDAQETIQLHGEWIWPGFVDSHVHFCDPGSPEREK